VTGSAQKRVVSRRIVPVVVVEVVELKFGQRERASAPRAAAALLEVQLGAPGLEPPSRSASGRAWPWSVRLAAAEPAAPDAIAAAVDQPAAAQAAAD
jgi:hypothetical protein